MLLFGQTFFNWMPVSCFFFFALACSTFIEKVMWSLETWPKPPRHHGSLEEPTPELEKSLPSLVRFISVVLELLKPFLSLQWLNQDCGLRHGLIALLSSIRLMIAITCLLQTRNQSLVPFWLKFALDQWSSPSCSSLMQMEKSLHSGRFASFFDRFPWMTHCRDWTTKQTIALQVFRSMV